MRKIKRTLGAMMVTAVAAAVLTFPASAKGYDDYASAYNAVTANGGLEAKFDLKLEIDDEETQATGDFKLDNSEGKNHLYYEMDIEGSKVIQFSDGEYVYTESNGKKTKFKPNSDAKIETGENEEKMSEKEENGTFDTTAFMKEFSGMIEAGKIRELGLLTPIAEQAVSKVSTKKEDGEIEYTLKLSNALVKNYLNIIIQNETGKSAGETVSIDELNDVTYSATSDGNVITGIEYGGVFKITVPSSLTGSGEEESYEMEMDLDIDFVNPGEAVTVELPDSADFEELK